MRSQMLRRVELLSLATAGVMIWGGSVASAQFSNTFDTSASFTTVATYNPPPMVVRFDYGAPSPTAHHSIAFDATQDNTGNSGGSLKLTQLWNAASDGAGSSAFVFDVFASPGELINSFSYDVKINAATTANTDPNHGYGYFQFAPRLGDSYSFDERYQKLYVNGTLIGSSGASQFSGPGYEFGNPDYSGATHTGWDHVEVDFTQPVNMRALTLQDYNNGNINGSLVYNIDNFVVTVPEPASLGLLALGVPALLKRRRSPVV